MRHLGSVVLALVAAPLGLLLAGRGLVGLAETAQADPVDYFGIAASSSALILAGLLLALLTMAQLSPLGPGLAGAGYVAFGTWALAEPASFLARLPSDVPGFAEEELTSAAQIAPLLAVPLLVTPFLPRRWRSKERPVPEPAGGARYGHPTTNTLDDIPRVPPPPPAPVPTPPPADETTANLHSDETTTRLHSPDDRPTN